MIDFIQTIIMKGLSLITTGLIGIGLISSPVPVNDNVVTTSTTEEITQEEVITEREDNKNTEDLIAEIERLKKAVNETNNNQAQPQPVINNPIESRSDINIINIEISPGLSTSTIQWSTNKPTESDIHITGGDLSFNKFSSENGNSIYHKVSLENLDPSTNYQYEIVAIRDDEVGKRLGSFTTQDKFIFEANIISHSYNENNEHLRIGIEVFSKMTNEKIVPGREVTIKYQGYKEMNRTNNEGRTFFTIRDNVSYGSFFKIELIDTLTEKMMCQGTIDTLDQEESVINCFE